MKTKFGIVGCGFLGGIVADAYRKGLLPDYELVGVTSRTRAKAEAVAEKTGCAVCDDMDALLALQPEYIVETASVEAVRAMAIPVLKQSVNLVVISIGAFADPAFWRRSWRRWWAARWRRCLFRPSTTSCSAAWQGCWCGL